MIFENIVRRDERVACIGDDRRRHCHIARDLPQPQTCRGCAEQTRHDDIKRHGQRDEFNPRGRFGAAGAACDLQCFNVRRGGGQRDSGDGRGGSVEKR